MLVQSVIVIDGNQQFGERLSALMRARGLNQSELARKSGVVRTTISRLITGKARPRQLHIVWMAQALGVDSVELTGSMAVSDELRELHEALRDSQSRIAILERERDEAVSRARDLARELDARRRATRT